MEMRPKTPATFSSFGCMKTLCLIFSVINAVTCILAFLSSVALLLFGLHAWGLNLYPGNGFTSPYNNGIEGWAFYYLPIIGFVCTAVTGLAIYFAILLCIGIQNDNKNYIKLYLRFGIAVGAFSLSLTLISSWLKYRKHVDNKMTGGLIAIVIIIVYTGFLEIIRKTYSTSEQSQEASGKLINQSNVPESYESN